ncbi:sigma-70 family RNA polymerase sigma factor [Bacillus suaedaesalsae]|uniref:Sigma-70 family RNA polymerase sigma factor n=1 Tax=Bacillus suaedaesalsae TaxID=2810349 RepID=A0ABS2DFZ6_9BACI|nr:sigma-70 family RNA polymerase sigma factor [Bacillus suaedaesalsae]MBM6617406.1 sigma-70 family RNA polymerase sigma factor [Bacillus suaedaesalsae]
MENELLIKRAIKGDEQAFYTLMLEHKDQLFRIAYSYLRNQEDSLEAIQEVTCRAFKAVRKVKEPAYFTTWLVRIMLNYCNDELRKKKRVTLQSHELDHATAAEDSHERIELEEAVDALDERSKQVITLKYFHDYKISDIAEIMECPEGTVKTWLHKALRVLRKQLDEKGGEKHV